MKKIYIVTDLGPGDGGKGGVVHKIATMQKAHTIIKRGGAQGSHGVVTASGDKFAFSQFGCGTFEGAKTYLSEQFVASPEGILNEARALRYECGIHDVFNLLTVDEDVVCATSYHGIASRVKELARGLTPRGTVGTGVGEAYRFSKRHPELTIRARDLLSNDIRDRLVAIRDHIQLNLEPIICGEFLATDSELLKQELELLTDPAFLDYIVQRFNEAGRLVNIVSREYLCEHLFSRDGVMVVESSHGILTDHFQGFHPHTSAIRTLPGFTRAMLEQASFDGDVVSIGVTRAYQIRHGAGPMPTAVEAMAGNLLPGSCKDENRYQGKVRVGPLDLVLLRYAIAASGGSNAYDGLAVTWFDQIQKNGLWSLCDSYQGTEDELYFTPDGEIRLKIGEDSEQLAHQERLGEKLRHVVPNITDYPISTHLDREKIFGVCDGVLKERLGTSVRMMSFGPTEEDKACI